MPDKIVIRGARVHNLKNVNIEIPKNKLVVITGLSGSGKSSLAFDTIYAEGQRRYAESLSAYARQFMEVRDKPDVDGIDGLSPTIAIDQKVFSQNPRSTVGTVTEIYDYLRLLFARAGEQYCPDCKVKVLTNTSGEISEHVRKMARRGAVSIFSPIARRSQIDHRVVLDKIEKSGYEWVMVNGEVMKLPEFAKRTFKPGLLLDVSVMVGKISDIKKDNPTRFVDLALDFSNGLLIAKTDKEEEFFSIVGLCPKCDRMLPVLDVRSFSFNSPYGACQRCTGLGLTMEVDVNLVVPNPRLTLAEGAIQPWTRITGNQSWYQKMLATVAEEHGFSLNVPWENLSDNVREMILNGTGKEVYTVENKSTTYVGVVNDLRERHLQTTSEYVRKEVEQYMREMICPECLGKRLRPESLAVKLDGYTIADLACLSVEENQAALKKIGTAKIKPTITAPIIKELLPRLSNLEKVGLEYLSLDRSLNTLSGGEVTRVRLSSQLSSGLTGVIYVLDEPSMGLHPRDNQQLIGTLKYLRDFGNSVIVVEHDAAMMEAADYLVDVGPGAGVYGGEIVAKGTVAEVKKNNKSLTGLYLSGKEKIHLEKVAKKPNKHNLTIVGAKAFNLKNVTVNIPLGKLVCVTGVSGSGKSTLIGEVLAKALLKKFYRAKDEPGAHKEIKGIDNIDKVISVDQTPIGRTPRSNPATYTGIFTLIRDLFSDLPEARLRGYDAGKFSFNVKGGGRCEACSGDGYIRIPMQFLADVFVVCNECNGSRYNQEALEVHYHNKNIADVLQMTVEEAYKFFNDIPALADKLNLLRDVGLGYLRLGQPATTLSGGEAQRIKLATELVRSATGKTLYILDEPTTGLHFSDIQNLLGVLERLVEKGNTVLVIEHNVDVIRCSDWVIELGPEGGKGGGELIAEGTPSEIKKNKKSKTGKYL